MAGTERRKIICRISGGKRRKRRKVGESAGAGVGTGEDAGEGTSGLSGGIVCVGTVSVWWSSPRSTRSTNQR